MTGGSSTTTPYWATEQFFHKALRTLFSDAKVQNFRVWLATGKGDNYLSELYRAEIEFTSKGKPDKMNLIVKVMPEGNETEEVIIEMGVFPKEISMYTQVLPKLKKLLQNFGIVVKLSSECITSYTSKPTCIVMQDLATDNYKMADRTAGLDMKHCTLVLEKIAHMHAASMIMEQKEPHTVTDYAIGILRNDSKNNTMNQLLLNAVQELAEATTVWKGYEKYSKKLMTLKETILEQGLQVTKMRQDGINVLNHGDLWINNILFKYGSNAEPIDAVFVDFQLSLWSSLGIDLNYFLCTSPKYELIINKRDYLIEHYHKTLVDVLKKLNYKDIPTLKDVKMEVTGRALYGLIAAVLVLPLVVLDRSATGGPMDMERLLDSSAEGKKIRQAVYRGKTYEKLICSLLPYFDDLGIF